MDVVIKIPLAVNTKLFCSCQEGCCPICLGMAGAMPLLNKEALKKTVIAANELQCKFTMASFFRVCSTACGKVGYLRSMMPAPFGVNGLQGKIKRLYLEEEPIISDDRICAGKALICIALDALDLHLASHVYSVLRDKKIVCGKPFFSFYDDEKQVVIIPKDPYALPQKVPECPDHLTKGFLTPEGFTDASLYPTEPELDACFVLIDPYNAKQVLSGNDIIKHS